MIRPFFSYYGSRWSMARHYPEPMSDRVIEPFAGSAGYSTYWAPECVTLVEKDPDIAALWRWLIRTASPEEVMALPESFERIEEVEELPRGPRLLVKFWVNKGRAEAGSTLSSWYFTHRGDGCKVWGRPVQERVASQLHILKGWEVWEGDYTLAPLTPDAHYHLDPPFSGHAGRRYRHNALDYGALAEWAQSLPGFVQVCESADAGWLPFRPLRASQTTRGKRSGTTFSEGIWTND